jgi:hypothetical protein
VDWIDVAQDRDEMVGSFECGNENSASTKCRGFLDGLMKDYI